VGLVVEALPLLRGQVQLIKALLVVLVAVATLVVVVVPVLLVSLMRLITGVALVVQEFQTT
jgi:hypothetical protein